MIDIRAVVFDFDGLILDTEMPIYVAWCEQFEAHGCAPPTLEEYGREIGTVNGLDLLARLREGATRPVDVDALQARRKARRNELIEVEIVRPGVEAWLDEADALGLPLAVASSSSPRWVENHLNRLGLRKRFAHIACRRPPDVMPKPAPDTYLEACEAVGVAPRAALAVEDSPNGALAAKAAGLWCVVVPHAITESLDLSHADVRVDSLASATLSGVIAKLA
jgi:HAD superfamily hydrolase (TIGR01509 family)